MAGRQPPLPFVQKSLNRSLPLDGGSMHFGPRSFFSAVAGGNFVAAPALVVVLLLAASFDASAAEGQWLPEQIAELDQERLKKMGLSLSPDALWDGKGGGILRGVVNVRGCSGGFVSKDGLVATNHHCAYGALQAASRVAGTDYLGTGLVAQSRDQEVRAPGLWIQVLESIEDVTKEVRAAADAATDDKARAVAVEQKVNALLLDCEAKKPGRRCRIEPFEMGGRFLQFTTLELRDIRMAFAPPSSLGNFGGEVDNWMWPRHAADVTLVRAYVSKDGAPAEYSPDNVPFQAPAVLPVTAEGVDEGSFVMTCGYPGQTQRYLSAGEVSRQLQQVFPGVISTYGAWIAKQEELGQTAPDVKLKVAARMRSLMNRHKNARGMVAGMERMKLQERRAKEDAAVAKSQGAELTQAMDAVADAYEKTFERDVVLFNLRRILPGLGTAIDLQRRAREAQKPEVERNPRYMARSEAQLLSDIERNLRDYDDTVEVALLDDVLARLRALDGDAKRGLLLGSFADPAVDGETIVANTQMGDKDEVVRLFESKTLAQDLANASKTDRLLALGAVLASAIEVAEAEHKALEGKLLAIGPKYFGALKSVKQGPIYPDANGTLRFSYAQVRGYSSQDGLYALPQTTLDGAIAKHTGVAPFVLPKAVRAKAGDAKNTAWADGELGALPVNFLSTSDTTGGNSGSPVLDGKGRLIGFNFDRVWENIAGDFGYHPSRSRNITVDVRYVLWLLDRVYNATNLLEEMGVAGLRQQTTPVDTAQPSPVMTAVLAQVQHDAVGGLELDAPTTSPTIVGAPPASKADGKKSAEKKEAPRNTSAMILAVILLLGGFALLIGRREKD